MNKVILMGRLTRDAEVRYAQGENAMAIARFTMAVERRGSRNNNSNEPNADFISCIAFGKTAEFLERYGKKGTKLVVEGRIQTGSYTNRDGQKVYTTDVVVESTEFAESKGNGGNTAQNASQPTSQSTSAPTSRPAAQPAPQPAPADLPGFMMPDMDIDIPFPA